MRTALLACLLAPVLLPAPASAQMSFEAYIKGSNTDAEDRFGHVLAASGDTLVVSAQREASGATGVDGDQSDNSASFAGAVYVFVRDGGGWAQQAYIKPSNMEAGDAIAGVAVDGDTLVLGAWSEDSAATGVDGDQSDNSLAGAGAAYVFVRNGTTWTQQAYLKASNTGLFDNFGRSVAVSGDTIVVGAPGEDSSAQVIDGDQTDNLQVNAGAAYVFVRNGSTWSQQAYLKADNGTQGDWLGESVAISGDTIAVGAPGFASLTGAAYAFVREAGSWSQQGFFTQSAIPGQLRYFGRSVSVSGDSVAIGAPEEDGSSPGINGPRDAGKPNAGCVWVYARDGATWSEQAYVKASDPGNQNEFGTSVALDGDTLLVGSPGEGSTATGVHADQDGIFGDRGAAYVFTREGGTWRQHAFVKASNTEQGDQFGVSTALAGDALFVGSTLEDGAGTGVGADQADNGANAAGAVYAYDLGSFDAPWTDFGNGLAGASGAPVLVPSGDLTGGSLVTLDLSAGLALGSTNLVIGVALLDANFKGGVMVPATNLILGGLPLDASGSLLIGFPWPTGVPAGVPTWYQYWSADPSAPAGFSASNAVRGVTP